MCKKCEENPVYEFTNQRKLCKNCFVSWFEKKFLYTIRKFEMIKKGETIGYFDFKDFRNVVLENLLKMFSKKGTIKLIKFTNKKISETDRVALADSVDKTSLRILDFLLHFDLTKETDFKVINKKIIKPLYLFLDKEILIYAKLKDLKFEKIENLNLPLENFLNDLEKKHPEVKQAIVKGFLSLEK